MNPSASSYNPNVAVGGGSGVGGGGYGNNPYDYQYDSTAQAQQAQLVAASSDMYNPYSASYGQQQQQQQQQQQDYSNSNSYNPYAAGSNELQSASFEMQSATAATGGYYSADGYFVPHDGLSVPSNEWYDATTMETTAASASTVNETVGSYYPVMQAFCSSHLYGSPITAVAYDTSYDALYAATVTLSSSSSSSSYHRNSSSSSSSHRQLAHQTRSAVMVTHSISNWHNDAPLKRTSTTTQPTPTTLMLYSAVASHPEAPSQVLNALYASLYGAPTVTSTDATNTVGSPSASTLSSSSPIRTKSQGGSSSNSIPHHAYTPPYGRTDPCISDTVAAATAMPSSSSNTHTLTSQLGVTSLVPVAEGTVASVSPAALRVHTAGGMQLADLHVEGLLAATIHPSVVSSTEHDNVSHLTVGGLPTRASGVYGDPNSSSHSAALHHLHSVDVWQGLQIVSSHALNRHTHSVTTSTSSTTGTTTDTSTQRPLAVTCLATSSSRGCVAVGCSDGTLRLVDHRNRDLATLKSHVGGVVDVAISNDGTLVATTGHGSVRRFNTNSSSSGSTSSSSSSSAQYPLYAYPDPTVLVYDLRFLGRGGFSHSFAGLSGGPRFVEFIPNQGSDDTDSSMNRLLVASGQVGGGCQVIHPFVDSSRHVNEAATSSTAASNFIVPNLQRGESISALCVAHNRLCIGTNQGRLLPYRMAGYQNNASAAADLNDSAGRGRGIFIPPKSSSTQSSTGTATATTSDTFDGGIPIRKELCLPPFAPPLSDVTLEATLLLRAGGIGGSDDTAGTVRMGETDAIKSIVGAYIMTATPTVSSSSSASTSTTPLLGDSKASLLSSFGPLAARPLVAQCKCKVSATLSDTASRAMEFVQTIPISEFQIDVFDDHRPKSIKEQQQRKHRTDAERQQQPQRLNPNKFLYNNELFRVAYGESYNRSKRYERLKWSYEKSSTSAGAGESDDPKTMDRIAIPKRYRLLLRPTHKSASSFQHSDYNESGLIPGYDYPPTMPNSFVPPVLLLLYFVLPELRVAASKAQLGRALTSSREQGLITELGYLFHRIDALAKYGPLFAAKHDSNNNGMVRIEAWAPTSFISHLTIMPEVERFQIMDGSPAAVDAPRRPEAFFRFLLYQLDSEMTRDQPSNASSASGSGSGGLLDALCGIDFVSINEFISGSGPPTKSTTRNLMVELIYDHFVKAEATKPTQQPQPQHSHVCFGDVLQYNLCRANRLRAWNQSSQSYETIVQRKIMTSLPTILSLSAACAGRKADEGLGLWRGTGSATATPNDTTCNTESASAPWLPEFIEVEIKDNGAVVVREQVGNSNNGAVLLDSGTNDKIVWKECKGTGTAVSAAVSSVVQDALRNSGNGPRQRRYRLQAVVSMIRDDLDRNCPEEVLAQREQRATSSSTTTISTSNVGNPGADGPFGHHIVHARVSSGLKQQILEQQHASIQSHVSRDRSDTIDLTLMGRDADPDVLQARLDFLQKQLAMMDHTTSGDVEDWVVVNGFVVANTTVEDARSFEATYREPSLVVYRAMDDDDAASLPFKKQRPDQATKDITVLIPPEVIQGTSITSTKSPHHARQKVSLLPTAGDVIAFDAEFVAVAEEESVLTATGTKLTIRDTRHALARISILDGRLQRQAVAGGRGDTRTMQSQQQPQQRTPTILLDDHVQPNEAVTDYLTRFSGIVARDLSPKHSRHHLITSRTAYLKLRCLVERGCLFVGHGLSQDFWTANLAVPANQIIDTVDIYHKPAQRYISLRFLTNYILKRDMQQDVHNSVEDAAAAFALYEAALQIKTNGPNGAADFDRLLNELYDYGQKCDWKLGVDDKDETS